jgi:hypothetical protein
MEVVMTFKEYLANRQVRDNIQGDFVKDARLDSRLPDVTTWAELKSYLVRSGAVPGAIEAAQLVWSAYQAKLRKIHNAQGT